MKNKYTYLLIVVLATFFSGCAKDYGIYPSTKVALQVDLSQLALPANTPVSYQNIELSMTNDSRWQELKRFKLASITDEVETMSSTYSNVILKVDVIYQNADGQQVVRPTHTQREADLFGNRVLLLFKLIDKK